MHVPRRGGRPASILEGCVTEETLLGIDVGTTGTKALLFAADGRVLASASKSYPLITPGVGLCEQNAEDWWDALVSCVRRVCADPALARSVRGISLSTQGGTVVPTDADFRPLANAIVWSDARCAADVPAFEAALGKDYVYRTCGWKLGRGLPAMELYRMRAEHPDLFEKAAYFLTVPGFVIARLTGRPASDISNAGIDQLTDIRRGVYDPAILELVGVPEAKLAPLVPSCGPVGTLTAGAAETLGLPRDVVVASGAHDQYAVALGAGICEAGDAVIGTGTAWVVTALRDEPDFESGFAQSLSATAGKWGSMLSISTGGVCLDWFRRQIAGLPEQPLDYRTLDALALERDVPGTDGLRFYPWFGGAGQPEPDNCSRGTFTGLDLSHDRGHLARAVMEGVACQTVWALRTMEKRLPMRRLFLAGGASKSPLWTRMIAEIAGRPIRVSVTADLACAGAAMMAGVGCGLFPDTVQAARAMEQPGRAEEPDAARAAAYRDVFEDYVSGARALHEYYGKRV